MNKNLIPLAKFKINKQYYYLCHCFLICAESRVFTIGTEYGIKL